MPRQARPALLSPKARRAFFFAKTGSSNHKRTPPIRRKIFKASVKNKTFSEMKHNRFFQLLFTFLLCVSANILSASANPPALENNGPTAVCDEPPTMYLNTNGGASIQVDDIFHFTGEGLTYSETVLNFNCSHVGIPQTRTVTVTDINGLSASCTKTFTVADTIPPTMLCKTVTVSVTGLVDIPVQHSGLVETLSDNCPLSIVPNTFIAGCATVGTHTVTLSAQNLQGNTFTCNATIHVIEAIPALVCRAILVDLDGNDNVTVTPEQLVLQLGALGCGGDVTLSASQTIFTCADIGSNSITVTATANSGGTTTCTATVVLLPGPPPPITCHDITVSLDLGGHAFVEDIAEAQNGCFYIITNNPSLVSCADLGQIQVTATLANSCTATVTVVDDMPPTIGCKNATVNLNAGGNATITPTDVFGFGFDNCGTVTPLSVSPNTLTCANAGANTVTLTATDGHGNNATCTATVTIVEDIPPTVTCKSITVNLGSTGSVTISTTAVYDSGNDNCGGIVSPDSVTPHTFTCSNLGANTVTLTVSDQAGNTATCTATVVVSENTAPVIACPANLTVAAGSACTATVGTHTPVSLSDNCTPSGSLTVTQSPAANTVLSGHNDVETVTLTATDGSGNTKNCQFSVTLKDVTQPTFSSVPAHVTVQCNSVPVIGTALASDNCSGVTVAYNGQTTTSGACTDTYLITRQWTATDAAGNTRTATQRINVVDTQKPAFTTTPAHLTVQCDAVPAPVSPAATDNCDASVAVTYNGQTQTNGACPNAYTITRTWTAADNCGNTKTVTQRITVVDNGKPVFTTFPGNTTIACSDAIPPVGSPTASDACGSATVTYLGQTTANSQCPGTYQIKRTWRATDACGNSTAATQTIQVVDNSAPVFVTVPAAATIECGQNLPPLGNPTATDACGGYVQITYLGQVPSGNDCEAGYTVTRSWQAADLCGNTATASQVITVQGNDFDNPQGGEDRAEDATELITHRSSLIAVFPNPTTDRVWIDLTGISTEPATVSIFSDYGQLVWEKHLDAVVEQRISVSLREAGAAAGMYTVRVQSGSTTVAKRLVLVQ